MAIPSQIESLFSITAAITAAPGILTTEMVSRACGVELREVMCATPGVRELLGFPVAGPFSIVSLRRPDIAPHHPILILTPRAESRFYQSDLSGGFAFARDLVEIDPRVPPEGTVTFREYRADKTLTLQFTGRSRLLRKLTVRQRD
ncbi:hypothetical protein [Nocardia yamanashiensis]|uniref:hypothetical protein n=1 Tax=Nocardia yamanashiensis TaxID=209247 RepID=UPI00082D23D0|nr:hypothetical protein [Nocardia yamanashiensis]